MDASDEEIASEASSQKFSDYDDNELFSADDDYQFPESGIDDYNDDDYALSTERRNEGTDESDPNKLNNSENRLLLVKRDDLEESDLITQFMSELGELPDLYTKLTPDDFLDEMDESDLPTNRNTKQRTTFTGVCKTFKTTESDEEENDDVLPNKRSAKEKTHRRKTQLDATLHGLMGEANICFVRGQVEKAEKICLEIIRQNPLASEPFFTLASIYENRDPEKFLNFSTIAAHLKPTDGAQWIRIAEMHIARNNLAQARVYYTKAIKYIPKDYDLRLRKARLLEQLGEENIAMFTYLKMLQYIPPEEHKLCISTAKNLVNYFHKHEKPKYALDAMMSAYGVCGSQFSNYDLNLYIDLLIVNKEYKKALDTLQSNTSFLIETNEEEKGEIHLCLIPEDIIPELRSKTCVCLIRLKSFLLSDYLIQNMCENIPVTTERLDLFIDVAEAFIAEGRFNEALRILQLLIEQLGDRCPAFVWLEKGDCLRNLYLFDEAIQSYQNVIERAPNCYEAKFTLAALLKQQGRLMDAIEALNQNFDRSEFIHARLLYEKCILLKIVGRYEQYFETGYVLLSRFSIPLRNREELFALANGGSFYNPDGLKAILHMRNMTEEVDIGTQEFNKKANEKSDLTIEAEFELFEDLIKEAFALGKFSFIEKLCFATITTKRFISFHKKLEPILILSCYFNDDCTIGFSYLRELIVKNSTSNEYWNLLSLFIQKGQHLRYHRFVRRLIGRMTNLRQMRIFLAHYHLHCGSLKYALNIYVPLFKETQQAIVALCIAVIFNQLSMQKKILRKSAALAQSITFAQKYGELRAPKYKNGSYPVQQEIFYNIGRIYHQSGLTHLAVEYYEKALASEDPLIEQNEKYLGLKQEVAYNLHLVYKSSGNLQKAREYLYKYIIV